MGGFDNMSEDEVVETTEASEDKADGKKTKLSLKKQRIKKKMTKEERHAFMQGMTDEEKKEFKSYYNKRLWAKKRYTNRPKHMDRPPRLWVKAKFVSYRRNKVKQQCHTAILHLQGVKCREDTPFYMGKRVAYVYKAKTLKRGSRWRTIWGKIVRFHGSKGCVRAKFRRNLPPHAMGAATLRVMLYPSNI